jgi:hypothetical protein
MAKFAVSYVFGATIVVEAEDAEAAEALVEEMPIEDLFDKNCQDGFDVTGAEETSE